MFDKPVTTMSKIIVFFLVLSPIEAKNKTSKIRQLIEVTAILCMFNTDKWGFGMRTLKAKVAIELF